MKNIKLKDYLDILKQSSDYEVVKHYITSVADDDYEIRITDLYITTICALINENKGLENQLKRRYWVL